MSVKLIPFNIIRKGFSFTGNAQLDYDENNNPIIDIIDIYINGYISVKDILDYGLILDIEKRLESSYAV